MNQTLVINYESKCNCISFYYRSIDEDVYANFLNSLNIS